MTKKKCVIRYNLIENDNPENRYWGPRERKKLPKDEYGQTGPFCCDTMRRIVCNGHVIFDGEQEIGLKWTDYEDTWHEAFRFCPFCGADIVYQELRRYRYVNRPSAKWVLEEVKHD